MKRITVLSILIFISCQSDPAFQVVFIDNPSQPASGEPFMTQDKEELVLSWVEERDSVDILYTSRFKGETFDSKTEIARSSNWFVNWADFPGMASFEDDKHLLTYWLEMSSSETYDYDVHISLSDNKGETWSLSKILHNDGVSAEHGFVSTALTNEGMMIVWLDGRNMTKGHQHDDNDTTDGHGSHGHGAMTLRSALVNSSGVVSKRLQIDNRVCECCQTDVVDTSCGPVAVYRNRSETEVRDVYYSRFIHEGWTDPKPVHVDNWQINGCPVNGPRIAAQEQHVSVVWYTQSNDNPKVQMVISSNCGESFSKPITIAEGDEVMGRLDIHMHMEHIYVTHMEQRASHADIILSEFSITGKQKRQDILAKNELSRKSGFPRMSSLKNQIFVVFRDVKLDKIQTLSVI